MTEAKDKAIRFLEIYDRLDRYMRDKLLGESARGQDDAHSNLIRKLAKEHPIFDKYEFDLLSFARLRNSIVHNPKKKLFDPIAEPHDDVLALYESLYLRIAQPDKVLDIATSRESMLVVQFDDRLLDTMRKMRAGGFHCVPVIKGGNFFGVFSESTVFRMLTEAGEAHITEEMTFAAVADYLPIDRNPDEIYLFRPLTMTVIEAIDAFDRAIEGDRRLMAIFITEKGHKDEYIQGMMTAWDVAGYEA